MKYQELTDNWHAFTQLVNQTSGQDELTQSIVKRYADLNIEILNNVLACSINHLKKLQKIKSTNDVICMQAKLTTELSKKLMQSAQGFLNSSLGNVSDYNEWLKVHCDLATD